MPIDYAEAAALAFGDEPFSVRDFRSRTGSTRPAQTLAELKLRGLVERVSKGRYRLLGPSERPDLRSQEWDRVRRVLLESPLPMAWSGPDAVRTWTGNRYVVSPSVYFREFTIE